MASFLWEVNSEARQGLVGDLIRCKRRADRYRDALERIACFPFDVMSSAERDLRAVKEIAERALDGSDD